MLLIITEDNIDESCVLLVQPYGILAVQAIIVNAQSCGCWQGQDMCRGDRNGVTLEGMTA